MSDNQARVSVRILEKEYHITCPIEERSDLLDSAEFLNTKMREIRDSGIANSVIKMKRDRSEY